MTKKANAKRRMASAWHTPEIHEIHMAEAVLAVQVSSSAEIERGHFPFVRLNDDIGKRSSGRPSFEDPVLKAAKRRINAGNYPTSLLEFSGEIVNEDFSNSLPEDRPAIRTVARIIRESDQWAEWRHLFRSRRKRL
jgi:hypothetical protein